MCDLRNAVSLARMRILKASLSHLDIIVSSSRLWNALKESHRGPEQLDRLEGRRHAHSKLRIPSLAGVQ
ncbi:hypothetical protein J3F83DRAFT_750224 [Trichoderma novae-zelandiae]